MIERISEFKTPIIVRNKKFKALARQLIQIIINSDLSMATVHSLLTCLSTMTKFSCRIISDEDQEFTWKFSNCKDKPSENDIKLWNRWVPTKYRINIEEKAPKKFIVEGVERLEIGGRKSTINFVTLADKDEPGVKIFFFYSQIFSFIEGFKTEYLNKYAKKDGMLTPKRKIVPGSANVEVSFSGAFWLDGMNPIYDKVSEETLSEEEFLKIINNGFSESETKALIVEISIGKITYKTAKNRKELERLTK